VRRAAATEAEPVPEARTAVAAGATWSGRSGSARAVPEASSSTEYLDIPAFLRRQAD
jgi:hypothetical protein